MATTFLSILCGSWICWYSYLHHVELEYVPDRGTQWAASLQRPTGDRTFPMESVKVHLQSLVEVGAAETCPQTSVDKIVWTGTSTVCPFAKS